MHAYTRNTSNTGPCTLPSLVQQYYRYHSWSFIVLSVSTIVLLVLVRQCYRGITHYRTTVLSRCSPLADYYNQSHFLLPHYRNNCQPLLLIRKVFGLHHFFVVVGCLLLTFTHQQGYSRNRRHPLLLLQGKCRHWAKIQELKCHWWLLVKLRRS
jgi:hypothetical protein